MQQDDAEPQSQAAKASKAWDSLPYSSFAGNKDSKVHPEEKPEKPMEKGQPEKSSMEVSATGETVQWRPTAANATMDQVARNLPDASEQSTAVATYKAASNVPPVRSSSGSSEHNGATRVAEETAKEASAPKHPVKKDPQPHAEASSAEVDTISPPLSEEKWMPTNVITPKVPSKAVPPDTSAPVASPGTAIETGTASSEVRPALLPVPQMDEVRSSHGGVPGVSGKFGAAPSELLSLGAGPPLSVEALGVALAAQHAAAWAGTSIKVSPEQNHSGSKDRSAGGINRGSATRGASLVEAGSVEATAQVPMMSASPMMSAMPAATVVAEAPPTTTTAPPTTAAATTVAPTTAAATTAAATTVAKTTEEEQETTEESDEEKVAVGAGSEDEGEEESEEKDEKEEKGKKGGSEASFIEQHFVLLAGAGVGVVALLVIGLICCCRR